ncbi:cupin domain-containing protein [Desulfocurvus vexinensis]|uniref:cupin domain-containing protein n=1 Tax=Desulfocurvus vexinensis TaxID=399548 RepID=UPI0004B2B3E7|nr:cupin domain-containing protein [Desulfocurvus vexinensis]
MMHEKNLLGQRIRMLRRQQGLTLRALADGAGCSESMLSKLENGKGNPSINVLHAVSRALGTNMGSLFLPAPMPGVVMRRGDRHLAQLGPGNGQGVILEYLSPHLPGHVLQAHIHIIEPGGGTETITHEGEEAGYVLEGELALTVDGEAYHLHEGDSFFFDSSLPHSTRNPGQTTARVLWVNTPPTF